jgi:hypothetical protein
MTCDEIIVGKKRLPGTKYANAHGGAQAQSGFAARISIDCFACYQGALAELHAALRKKVSSRAF